MARSAVPVFAIGAPPRVNLMPRVAIERRQRSSLLRRWGWGLAGTLLTVALVSGGAYALQAFAEQRLSAENARTEELMTQLGALQPISQKLSLESQLSEFRSQAMATDLDWTRLLATIHRVLPEDVAITDFALAPAGVPVEGEPEAQTGVSGEIILGSTSAAKFEPLILAVREIPQVIEADGWIQEYADGYYAYTLRLQIDQTVYSGAYAEEETQ
jgi:hypothetical protein